MSDRWTPRLSDHLDGGLTERETEALERHLETCDACRRTLEELRAVRDCARTLVDPSAPDDLWAGIARRIGAAGPTSGEARPRVVAFPGRARRDWPLPQLVAAGFAAILMGAAAYSLLRAPARPAEPPAAPATAAAASFDAAQVESEIAELLAALERGRDKLDPRTVEVLERNLALIRQATEDAKAALAADPANAALQGYFAVNVERKLDLVRRATRLAGV